VRRVAAAPAVLVGIYFITLAAALPLAAAIGFGINEHLGSSLTANDVADSVNYDWWQEFVSQGSSFTLTSTFTPSILGFATTLDSLSGLIDKRPIVPAIALALGFYMLVWVFLQGGILDRYARGRRVGAYGFFAASGIFFLRFLRLGIVAGIGYWFLFAYVHEWLFAKWYVNVTRDVAVERTAFYWRVLMYAIFIALLALTTTVLDYAKVRAVVEDRRSMAGALIAAIRFIVRNPGRVAGLSLTNTVLFLGVVGVDVGRCSPVTGLHPGAADREAAGPRIGNGSLPAIACPLGLFGGSDLNQARTARCGDCVINEQARRPFPWAFA